MRKLAAIGWVRRHPIWSALIGLIVAFVIYKLVTPTKPTYEYVAVNAQRGDVTRIVSAWRWPRRPACCDLRGKVLTILDPKALQRVAKFDSSYLHLARTERRDPEVSGRAGDLVSTSAQGILHDAAAKVKSVFEG